MPETTSNKNKTPINCRNFTVWEMTDEDAETYSSTAHSMAGKMMNFSDTLTTNTTPLNGDGVVTQVAYGTGTGQLTVGIHNLTDAERHIFYSETLNSAGVAITTGKETPPSLAVALVTDCTSDGKIVNLYKWFNVRFAPHETSVSQIENGQITFSTTQIQGTYTRNSTLNMMRAQISHVDTSTTEGKTLMNTWLSQADYVGV